MSVMRCLPYPWPPHEPEEPPPGQEALDSDFDWSVCTHPELYRMATTGVDSETADEVARKWGHLGGRLQEIGEGLQAALRKASEGWRGGGAEQAKEKVDRLSQWTEQTSRDSHGVANAVRAQAHLARWAKNAMPEPLQLSPLPLPLPSPPPSPLPSPLPDPRPLRADSGSVGGPVAGSVAGSVAGDSGGLVALGGDDNDNNDANGGSGSGGSSGTGGSGGGRFGSTIDVLGDGSTRSTGGRRGDEGLSSLGGRQGGGSAGGGGSSDGGGGGGGFSDAVLLPSDPDTARERQRELHRRAAEVMRTYQLESGNVFRGVPQFVMPGEGLKDDGGGRERGRDPEPPPPENEGTDPSGGGRPDHAGGFGGMTPGVVAAPLAAGAAAGMAAGHTAAPGMATGAGATGSAPGGATAAVSGGGGQAGSSAAAAAGGRAGAAPVGGMMGGAAGARPGGDEENEHSSPSYLQEEDDVWGMPTGPIAPPVIGERDWRGNE